MSWQGFSFFLAYQAKACIYSFVNLALISCQSHTLLINFHRNKAFNRSMMQRRPESINLTIRNSVQSPAKNENVCFVTVGPALDSSRRYVSNSIHHSSHPHLTQNTWTHSTDQPFPKRVLSPSTILNHTQPQPVRKDGFIELGGNKKNSLEKTERESEVSVVDGLNRKVVILEARIKDLHREKQMMAAEINEKMNKMLVENERLMAIIQDYELKRKESQKEKTSSFEEDKEEFDLEAMLETQINLNLQLREELETTHNQWQNTKSQLTKITQSLHLLEQRTQILQTDRKGLTETNQQLQSLISSLHQKIDTMQQARLMRQKAIQELIEDKQKKILNCQDSIFDLTKQLQEKQKELSEQGEQLSSEKMQRQCENDQREHLRKQVDELILKVEGLSKEVEKQQECKKCKELLHTVFRLNCQLNRK